MSNVKTRIANSHDSVALARLAKSTFLAAFETSNEPRHIQEYVAKAFSPAQIGRELLDEGSVFFVAERDAQLIGYAKIRQGEAPECIDVDAVRELERIYVAQEYIGTGVGRMLLDAAVAQVQEQGATHVWLGVWEDNPEAVAFYHKCGYQTKGTKTFMMGSDPQTDLVMLLEVAKY